MIDLLTEHDVENTGSLADYIYALNKLVPVYNSLMQSLKCQDFS